MKAHQVHIKDNIDTATKNLIADYWKIIDGKFVFKTNELSQKYNIKIHEITKIVMINSHVTVARNCNECGDLIIKEFKNRSSIAFFLTQNKRSREVSCQKCEDEKRRILNEIYKKQEEERKLIIEQEKLAKEERFQEIIKKQEWEKLNSFEYSILQKIIEFQNLNKIKKEVFNGNYQDKFVWAAINKLEKVGFIHVERKGWGNSITSITSDPRLKIYIKKPNLLKKVDYLAFSLAKKDNKTHIKQPDYSGTFVLQTDVVLKAGVKYIYGGWIQTDNSINLKFTPLEEINIVKQSTVDEEPKIVGEIIREMLDDIQNIE